jgi:hypothetical protein
MKKVAELQRNRIKGGSSFSNVTIVDERCSTVFVYEDVTAMKISVDSTLPSLYDAPLKFCGPVQ